MNHSLQQRVRAHIAASWDKTVRTSPDDPTHVRVPYPYTVPSIEGAFQEMYYWDTYFTDRGLLLDGRLELARQNCDNMLYLVDTYGFMPNGTRTWYLTRSQPPYLMIMVLDVFEKSQDRAWLQRAYPILKREYETWTTGDQLVAETGLSRYFDRETDRQNLLAAFAGVAGRIGLPTDCSDDDKMRHAQHALAECTSGWDFTPRFENRCLDFIPVDLNANLYLYELGFATIAEILGDGSADAWREKAAARRERLERFCWSEARGLYLDYDFVNRRHTTVASLATFQPLWAGMAAPDRAARVRENLPLFERDFGLATCEAVDTGSRSYQWGYPNGWAPLHLIAVEGLQRYGYDQDATRIADKYLAAVAGLFDKTGNLWEKYNVSDGSLQAVCEYDNPEMLGWTAGVFVVFADGRHELAPAYGDQA
jgi:alpha,alpha-trehalase